MLDIRNLVRTGIARVPRHAAAAFALAGALILTACGDEAPEGARPATARLTSDRRSPLSFSTAAVRRHAAGRRTDGAGAGVLSRRGQPLANEIVNFSLGSTELATLSPSTGAVLTDGTHRKGHRRCFEHRGGRNDDLCKRDG